MDKNRIFVSFSIFIFLLAVGGIGYFLLNQTSEKSAFIKLLVGNQIFEVEIADEPLEHSRGLSGRANLPENQGMFFIFPDLANRTFWMSGMKFSLDIIWIKDDQVVGMAENLPPAASGDPIFYSSSGAVNKVLEINAGLVKKLGLKIGDKVLLY